MSASLRVLLAGAIDYAGMFPPAKLPLQEAFRNYQRYRESPDAWMLGRFICPAAIIDLRNLLREKEVIAPFEISFIMRMNDARTMLREIGHVALLAFGSRTNAKVGTLEFDPLLSSEIVKEPRTIPKLITILDRFRPPACAFFETQVENTASYDAHGFVQPLQVSPNRNLGMKIRCGGLQASSFPSPKSVAHLIALCSDARIPLKFTAGLHHPLRHFNRELKTMMHGFINILSACVLAYSHSLEDEQIETILLDEDPKSFVFEDTGFRWQKQHATLDQIIIARKRGGLTFGSCSFDEPRDDLRKLGWLL
jgi:hypothetical protein